MTGTPDGVPRPGSGAADILRSPYTALVLTAALWGGNWIAGRGVYDHVPPVALSFWRWAIAVLILLPFVARGIWDQRVVIRREWVRLVILGALGCSVFNVMIFTGLHTTTAINGSLLNATLPIYVIILTSLGLGERSGWRQVAGIAVSLVGVAIIISRGDLVILLGLRFSSGDLWILAAMLVWALYSVLLKYWPTNLQAFTFLGVTAVIGLVLLAPLYVWEIDAGRRLILSARAIAGIVYLGAIASTVAYLFWIYGVRRAGAGTASLFLYLIPVFASIFAVILLGESIHLFHLAGTAFIASGIAIATVRREAWARWFQAFDDKGRD